MAESGLRQAIVQAYLWRHHFLGHPADGSRRNVGGTPQRMVRRRSLILRPQPHVSGLGASCTLFAQQTRGGSAVPGAKKAAAKKAVGTPVGARKEAATKLAAKKVPGKGIAVRKATAKNVPAKKATAKKVAAKKAPAKKVAAKKAPATKAPAKKLAAKKAAAKKTAAKKTAAKKTTAKKTTAKKALPPIKPPLRLRRRRHGR